MTFIYDFGAVGIGCDNLGHGIHVRRYVYQLRDLVRLYGTEEETANSLPELERTEDWLYNEGSATDNPGARI